MKKLSLIKRKFKLEDEIEAVLQGKVKSIGNGAMILAEKKYIGKNAYILIAKN